MREYGSHRDDDAPRTVTVYGAGTWPVEEERPMPKALLRQRRRINDIARNHEHADAARALIQKPTKGEL